MTDNTLSSYGKKDQTEQQRGAQSAKGAAKIMGSFLDYQTQKSALGWYKLQAQELELNAVERSNMLTEQFNQSLGVTAVSAAQRGLAQSSGSVKAEREISAINVGQDIQTMKSNARMKASSLRAKVKVGKYAAKAQMLRGMQEGGKDIASAMVGGGA